MVAGQGVPQLTTIYFYLTEGCNCACRHCWIVGEQMPGRAGREAFLGIDVLRRAIKEALPLGLASLKWTGGEPTLHPEFENFLRLQKDFGLAGLVETNGMLVTESLARLMLETGVEQVSVSLDSANESIHDAIRGVAGGFKRTVNGIKNLVSNGIRPELILTLQKLNFHGLDNFFQLAEELDVGSVKLNILQPVLRAKKIISAGDGLSVSSVLDLAVKIENDYSARYSMPIILDVPMAFRPLAKVISGERDNACNILNIIGVLPRGEYALCGVGQHVPELAMGDVLTSALAEVWASHPVLHKVRAGLPMQLAGICSQCLMQAACLGGCVAANYQLSGDLLAPFWFCREAYELGLFPESRQRSQK